MHLLNGKAAVVALALLNSCNALKVTILADTNRDGKVDKNDVTGKSTWTNNKGALILPNIGDTGRRCAKKWGPSADIQGDESYLDKCNDASDNVQRNPKYLAPLKTLPLTSLSASAKGSISIADKAAASKVRIFVKQSGKWNYVAADHVFTAKDLSSGLELGVDARDVRRPQGWNGYAKIQFTVTDGKAKATDAVAVRVAPVLTHHHGQHAQRIFTTGVNEAGFNRIQEEYVADLLRNVGNAGIKEPVFQFHNQDIWTQDFFETGYASIPGPNGPVSIRIMIRSVQSTRRSGRDAFHDLRNDQVGAVQHPGDGDSIDSTGNLETIPPYSHNGKSFPVGRTIMGAWEGRAPLMVEFLKAQQVQDPLILDTSWLYVGHVDEFIQFLPSDNKRGWVIMVADPMKGVDLLKNAAKAGHGQVKAVSRPLSAGEKKEKLCLPRQTIAETLKFKQFDAINKHSAERIQANLDIIKQETGITEEEIHRVPTLFYYTESNSWLCAGESSSQTAETASTQPQKAASNSGITMKASQGGPSFKAKSIVEAATPKKSVHRRVIDPATQVTTLYPDSVNSLVMTDSRVLVPNPWGPVINKQDIFAAAVSEIYANVGYNVTYQDDWFSHYRLQGDVHCGSNSWRDIPKKWW
ncbi:hypothetical protein FPOAC2_05348 [Fusarium poae]|uniref:hypothetical protein n=1 Tax=Fusarium poae TaxID=36050 RepID=UPI001CEA2E90|nr:hypothetical protein FPOAC1_005242 [Fusarium poae]KAG8671983.1 hypothetical protein FPOAC1_005242 [Fusarium poae]